MMGTHQAVGGARTADGGQETAGFADFALAFVVVGELKVFTLLLGNPLVIYVFMPCRELYKTD